MNGNKVIPEILVVVRQRREICLNERKAQPFTALQTVIFRALRFSGFFYSGKHTH